MPHPDPDRPAAPSAGSFFLRTGRALREIGIAALMGMLRLLVWPLYALSLYTLLMSGMSLMSLTESFRVVTLVMAVLLAAAALLLFRLALWGRTWYDRLRDTAPPGGPADS